MVKKEVEYLSKSAYARYLGIDEKLIRKAVLDGKIKKGYDIEKQKIIKHIADKEFGQLYKVVKPRPGVSSEKLIKKIRAEEVRTKIVEKAEQSPKNSDLEKSEQKTENKSEKKVKTSEQKPKKKSTLDIDEEEDLFLEGLDFNPNASLSDIISLIEIYPTLSYAESLRRQAILNLATDKMKFEELNGVLLRKTDVDKVLYIAGDQLKKAIMAVPQRCADELLNADNKVDIINILNKELTEILKTFANFEDLKLRKQ